MCGLIYKVLTPEPGRISIVLGKWFPSGPRLSATAYRCSMEARFVFCFRPRVRPTEGVFAGGPPGA